MIHRELLGDYVLDYGENCFPYTQDSDELIQFATLKKHDRVCDLGCGCGTILIGLKRRETDVELTGIEILEEPAGYALQNLKQNGIIGTILNEDLRQTTLSAESFDLIVSNPPYYTSREGMKAGPERNEENCTFAELIQTAAYLCKNKGRVAICIRPDRMAEMICLATAKRLVLKRIRFVHHTGAKNAVLVLMEFIKNGNEGVQVLPALIRNEG